MRVAIVVTLALAYRAASAGPYCGGRNGWSPAGATLPPRPHVVFWQQDSSILPRGRAYHVARPKLSATIDGKPVAIRSRVEGRRDARHDLALSRAFDPHGR